jgi:hypothetical protein
MSCTCTRRQGDEPEHALPGRHGRHLRPGARALYGWLKENPSVRMLPVIEVNDASVLCRLPRLYSINGALSVDLGPGRRRSSGPPVLALAVRVVRERRRSVTRAGLCACGRRPPSGQTDIDHRPRFAGHASRPAPPRAVRGDGAWSGDRGAERRGAAGSADRLHTRFATCSAPRSRSAIAGSGVAERRALEMPEGARQ